MTKVESFADVACDGSRFLHKWYLDRSGAKATWRVLTTGKTRVWTEMDPATGQPIERQEPVERAKWRFSIQAEEPTYETFRTGFALYGLTADEFDDSVAEMLS